MGNLLYNESFEAWQFLYCLYIGWLGGLMIMSIISKIPDRMDQRRFIFDLRNTWVGRITILWVGLSFLVLIKIWPMLVYVLLMKELGTPFSAWLIMGSATFLVAYLHFSRTQEYVRN